MKKQLTLITLLLTGAFLLFWSCSNDSTNSNLTEGDYTSQDFLLASEDADSTVSEIYSADIGVAGWLNWHPGTPMSDSVEYDSTSGWHVKYVTYQRENMETTVNDSFRFSDVNGQFQFQRNSATDRLERRYSKGTIRFEDPDSLGTTWMRGFRRSADWTGLTTAITTLNGNFKYQWQGMTERRLFMRQVQGNMNDLKYNTSDFGVGRRPHPITGTADATMYTDVQTPLRHAHLEGNLVMTFFMENGEYCYHARLVRGSNFWEWDRCFQ